MRPNTRLHDQPCDVKKALANSEPSTHGAKRKWAGQQSPLPRSKMNPFQTSANQRLHEENL